MILDRVFCLIIEKPRFYREFVGNELFVAKLKVLYDHFPCFFVVHLQLALVNDRFAEVDVRLGLVVLIELIFKDFRLVMQLIKNRYATKILLKNG